VDRSTHGGCFAAGLGVPYSKLTDAARGSNHVTRQSQMAGNITRVTASLPRAKGHDLSVSKHPERLTAQRIDSRYLNQVQPQLKA
jgi:hypothetical protein